MKFYNELETWTSDHAIAHSSNYQAICELSQFKSRLFSAHEVRQEYDLKSWLRNWPIFQAKSPYNYIINLGDTRQLSPHTYTLKKGQALQWTLCAFDSAAHSSAIELWCYFYDQAWNS